MNQEGREERENEGRSNYNIWFRGLIAGALISTLPETQDGVVLWKLLVLILSSKQSSHNYTFDPNQTYLIMNFPLQNCRSFILILFFFSGEDPYLSGQFGTAYTVGLQNGTLDPRYLQAVVTLKHWDAYLKQKGSTRSFKVSLLFHFPLLFLS